MTTKQQDDAGSQPGEVRSSAPLGLAERLRRYVATGAGMPEARRLMEQAADELQDAEAAIAAAVPNRSELLSQANTLIKDQAAEIARLRDSADSEGTRAVEYLRRARKAEDLLRELSQVCTEVNDHTPESWHRAVLRIGNAAAILLRPNVLVSGAAGVRST